MPRTDNAVVIDRPLDEVWERMNDVESWPQLFSEYAKAEIMEREGNTVKFRLTTPATSISRASTGCRSGPSTASARPMPTRRR